MADTKTDLNTSLWSPLKAGQDKTWRSVGGVFSAGASNSKKTSPLPNQITATDVAYEQEQIKMREVKILV